MTAMVRKALHPLLVVLLAAVSALLLAVVVLPLVLGWVPLTVLSGSMEPTVPTGSQVVVEPLEGEADAARLSTGDVVTFMPRPDDDTLVTHRIVAVAVDGEGRRSFTTQGDANAAPDAEPVTATQLRGLVKYHVPWAGHAATLLDAEQKRGGVVLVAAALFGYALWQLVGAVRDRGGRPAGAAAPVPPQDARTERLSVVSGGSAAG
ncbi:signal peptidase I [Kocuria sediminis]|uniref:Signal peptidase I n=1 Tax=Kocuria sediminis TaxID=1038857 RepID=A0A6N8GRM2_9MICC|nr:signal peptidase I [Kocuria sediminis]MUN63933.1 signal peptidase I [Kocuria sediminis]